MKAKIAAVVMLLPSAASAADYCWVGADPISGMSYYLDVGALTNNGRAVERTRLLRSRPDLPNRDLVKVREPVLHPPRRSGASAIGEKTREGRARRVARAARPEPTFE